MHWAVLLFWGSFAISTFSGVDWYRSFWDNHERMLGLFTVTHYVLFYFLLSSLIHREKDWLNLCRFFLGAGTLVMLIGAIQKFFNPEFLLNQNASRVVSTLGNPIYVSGYGLFLLSLGVLIFLHQRGQSRVEWQWYAGIGAGLGFLGIFLGGTRGTLLGLLVGVGVSSIVCLVLLWRHRAVRNGIIATLLALFVLAGLFFAYRKTPFVQHIPAVGGLANVSLFDGTANTRLMAWGIAITAWKDYPLFGWGPNNFYYAFNSYYRPEFLLHGWGETWFDNAHNIVMNTLATQGAFGILVYAGLFASTFVVLIRAYRRKRIDVSRFAVIVVFLTAHFVHNIFVFENPTSYLYFFFFLAYLYWVDHGDVVISRDQRKGTVAKPGMSFAILSGIVAFLFVFATDINAARANTATLQAIKTLSTGQVDSALALYQRASSIPSPHIDDIRSDVARYIYNSISATAQKNPRSDTGPLFVWLLDELEKNRVLHPMDIRTHLLETQLSNTLRQSGGDPRLLIREEQLLDEAQTYSPKRQQIQYLRAGTQFQLGNREKAIEILKQSVVDSPFITEGWMRLIVSMYDSGEEEKAKRLITTVRSMGLTFSDADESVFEVITSNSSTGL